MLTAIAQPNAYQVGASRHAVREAIIVAAKKQFYFTGYAATDLTMIAQRLPMRLTHLKRYFANKLTLFRACIDDNMRQLNEVFQPLRDSTRPPAELSQQWVEGLHALLQPDRYHDFAHCLATELMGSHEAENVLVNYVARWQQDVMQLLTKLTHKTKTQEELLALLCILQGSIYYQRIYRNPQYLTMTLRYIVQQLA
ncbi:MAG: hypothetical protein Tsb005_18940 [Gammaproteobacteria bacterium]